MTTWVNTKEWNPESHVSVLCVIQENKNDPNLEYEVCYCTRDDYDDVSWHYQRDNDGKEIKGEVKYWTILPVVMVKD